jgi:RNA polymerase sigma factor (sigma-70 family)
MASLVDAEDDSACEDAHLVSRIAGGDLGEPMEELYRRYAGKLYWFGLHLLGNAGLADELVQECFMRLWRTAGRFDTSRGTVSAYMFVIGRSIATDLHRRRLHGLCCQWRMRRCRRSPTARTGLWKA